MNEYRLYTIGGRPVFAVPAVPRYMRRVALQRVLPATVKRALYRHTVDLSMVVRIDWLFSKSIEWPAHGVTLDATDWREWLDGMREFFGVAALTPAIIWPKRLDRGRIYVHLFNDGASIGFAKISLQSASDARLLQEAETLRELCARKLTCCHVPRLLAEGRIAGHVFLLLEQFPASAQPLARNIRAYPKRCVDEYSGPIQRVDATERLSWWSEYIRKVDDRCSVFHRELTSLLNDEIAVCRAHGDLSPHNVVSDGELLWIYDWEDSVTDAPKRTDGVGFYLSLNQPAVRADPVRWTSLFKKEFMSDARVNERLEIIMALAFRHAAGIDDATLIIQNWRR